jgi:pyruvate dehydrogenase E1 component alpha subunit
MKVTWTPETLTKFENDVAEIYKQGTIRAPVHLRSGCEEQLIKIFENVKPEDYIFNYWASHLHCLLKGVPAEELLQAIKDGKSISLCFPEHKIYCSGIVGSLAGVAVGTAHGLKRAGKKEHVWLFTGDMGAETGIFHEALKYAVNFDLPITFVVEDNGVSVMTDTRSTWGHPDPWFKGTRFEKKVIYYKYKNGWPHSGLGQRIAF